jgi:eukaryotic-like serine/threonine-protein kinase
MQPAAATATTIGDYRIQKELARGAFGELLLAEGPSGERVVIKRLRVERITDDKALALFEREAGVLRSLRHRAVPRFVDCGVDASGMPYLVQQHIEGPTLEAALREGRRLDDPAAERLARDLLDVLDYLHHLHPPVIHRDIKPANIVLEDGRPVLVDFGAACGHALLPEETSDTVVGTFGYMAPEMLKGQVSPASDLYAVGATLLYAYSGREPETFPTERLRLRFREALDLPPRLTELLEALLEPAVEDRPRSAADALALLERRPGPFVAPRRGRGGERRQRKERGGLVRGTPGAESPKGAVAKKRRVAGLPLKPVVAVGTLVAIGLFVLLFPELAKLVAIGAIVLVVLVVVLLVAIGGV